MKRVDGEVPRKSGRGRKRDCATTTQGELVWAGREAFCDRTLKKTGKLVLPTEPGMAVVLCGLGKVTVSLSLWLRRLLSQELGGEMKHVSFGRTDFFPARSSFLSPLRYGEMKERWRTT